MQAILSAQKFGTTKRSTWGVCRSWDRKIRRSGGSACFRYLANANGQHFSARNTAMRLLTAKSRLVSKLWKIFSNTIYYNFRAQSKLISPLQLAMGVLGVLWMLVFSCAIEYAPIRRFCRHNPSSSSVGLFTADGPTREQCKQVSRAAAAAMSVD